jgi:hypothetical protein
MARIPARPQLVKLGFVCGFAVAAALQGFVMDLAGEEAWIAFERSMWFDFPWWIWPPIMFPLAAGLVYGINIERRVLRAAHVTEEEDERSES